MTTRTTRHLLRDFAASKTFRSTFVSTHAKRFIPLQLRDLFKQYKLTQLKLAALSGVPQGSISRALDVDYGNLTINTLTRLAAGLDVALVCKFVPFSTFLDGLDEEGDEVYVPSFDEEFGKQAKPAPVETAASKSNLTQFVARYTQPRERAQSKLNFGPPIAGHIAPRKPPQQYPLTPEPPVELYGSTADATNATATAAAAS